MRKGIAVLTAAMVLSVAGCGNSKQLEADNASLQAENEQLKAEKDSLTSELESVSTDYESVNKELTSIKESIESAEKETELQSEDVTVTVISKGELPADTKAWRFNNVCTLAFQITNNTDKDIQGIEGALTVKDLFGKTIKTMGCDFTGTTIHAGETITNDDLIYETNEFLDDDMKFYNTAFNDLKFEYATSQIVFTDGTVKQ